MNPATDMHFGKTPLTPSHGDSLVDQSFQSLKSKEIRDSLSPTQEIKFRNSGGVAGGVLVPDTTGWNVQTSSEVSPDGRAFRTESLAKTDGVEKIPGGHAEFAGRNEQKSSASHQGDDKNYVKKAAESSKTHLQEKVVIGDENSGRTEVKSSSVTSSSKVISSSSQQVITSDDPGFDMEPRRLTNKQDQHYQNVLQSSNNNSTSHTERQQYSRNEHNERQETSSNVREESKKYIDMDKASPEYQQHVQYLMSQPGAIVSNVVEYPKPGVKMITTVKKLPDGTTVKTKRYETDASVAGADSTSISQTTKQQQRTSSNTTTSQKMTEKRIQDASEDVFTRLARTRDTNVPASPRNAPDSPFNEDTVHSRLHNTRGVHDEQKFSDYTDQRSTQILRDTNQHPGSRNAPNRRPSDLVENVEMISKTNKTVKKDVNHQNIRSEKITSSDFIQNERDRYVLDHESPSRRGPDGYPEALAPITPSRHGRPQQPDDYPTNGYNTTEVIKQSTSSKSSAKFSESRRYSTETVESYQHSENENQDYTTRGYPSNRQPIDEPKAQSPSSGRPGTDFSTHGFPSVRSDKPTQQHPSDRPRGQDDKNTTERVHIIHTDRPRPGDVSHSDSTTTRSNYSTNETRRHHVTSTNEDFSTHGFPSVRAGTPTRDSPKRPLGSDSSPGESPRRPSGQEPPVHQARKPPSDGYSTHGFPSVRAGTPTEDSPRRPSSGNEYPSQGRRPTTEDFSTHGFPSVRPGRSTPTQSAPQYESSPRIDREDTVSVTSDRSNSVIYEKKIDAAHQAFARSLRCASPVESVRRDSTSDRHTPRSSIGSIRNSYSPSKRDGRSPSHDSVTNSESSRISSATVTKTNKPTEVRRVSGPKSPIGKSAPSHVSNETIDLSLTRKITAKPSPDKATTGRPTTGTTPNTSRRPHNTEEEVNTLVDTATKHITTTHSSPTTTKRSAKNKEPNKPLQPETIYSKKPINKTEGYITLNQANEITEKQNQTTNKHVSYPNYIPSAPKADRSPSDRPTTTTNNLSSPAPTTPTTTSTTPHNAPKSTKDKVKPPSTTTSSPTTTKPFSSPSKVDNSSPSRFTKTVKVENTINRDTKTKTRRQPELEPESELDTESLVEPEDLDEGYVPDRKGKRKPSSRRPTSDDEGFEPDSPRAGSPTSDFEYRKPEQVRTYDEEDSIVKKTNRTDKKVVTNDFLNTERNVTKTPKTQEVEEPSKKPKDRDLENPEEPKRPDQDSRKPTHSAERPAGPEGGSYPQENEPKRPSRRPKEEDTEQTPSSKECKPSKLVDEPRKNKSPINEPNHPEEDKRRPSYEQEPLDNDDKPSRPSETSRPRGPKPPLERSETFEERCRQILGMDSDTVVVDRTNKTQEFIDTERTTVDSKRKPSDRSPSPKKKQPSDTVSIEDCDDDDDDDTPRKYSQPGKTVKTTREYPREKSPNKKEPTGGHPRDDKSPVGKFPKGPKINEYNETTTVVTTTKTTDDRSKSPNRKSPRVTKPSDEHAIRQRDQSPSERPGRIDENKTIRKTTKLVDEIDEMSTRSKPGTRPEEKSPSFQRSPSPKKKQPSDTVSIEDCDEDDDLDRKYPTCETNTASTIVKTTRDHPRDRSPSEKGTNRKTPEDVKPSDNDDFRPRSRSPLSSDRSVRVDNTTILTKQTKIIDDIDKRSTRSKPREQSPDESQPREKSPVDYRLPSSTRPKDRSPENTTFITTRETTVDMETSRAKQPILERSLTDENPCDRSPTRKPVRGTSPSDEFPRNQSPTRKPLRGSSPTDKSPRNKSPSTKPVRGTSPTDESARYKSPTRKQIRGSTPSDEYPRDRSPTRKPVSGTRTNETITTTHSNVTDGVIEDRYPSYTPKSYPRDRSPFDNPKPKPQTTDEEEDEEVKTSKKTKKTSTEEIHDDVFDVNRPRGRHPDTRDGSLISYSRDQSPLEPTTKETDQSITKRTAKTTTIENEFTDKSPVSRPREYPQDQSPTKNPTTEETEEFGKITETTRHTTVDKEVTHRTPLCGPRDRTPIDDLTRPRTKEITETHRVDINEFLDTERGVDRPKRPIDNNRSPDRLTSSHPRDHPKNQSPTRTPKGPSKTDNDELTVRKTTKTTKGITVEKEVEDILTSTRPRDRSPNEKPIRSPRIVTTETTTEYGIESRPRSQSPSENPKKPLDSSEEIDESYVQKTSKITKKTITTDFDDEVEKPRRRPRPTGTEIQPREKSPQKSKLSDRSPSPRSKYPKDKGPRSKSPVGTQPKQTSPRQNSPSEKSRIYYSTDDDTNVVRTSKITKLTTEDKEDFEKCPRGRSTSEKPIGSRPTDGNQSPNDYLRRSSPSKKPEDHQPTESDYEETVVKKTNKTTRNETNLEETIDQLTRKYPEDSPREISPSSKPRGIIPSTEDRSLKSPTKTSPRGTSPTGKSGPKDYPRDRSPNDKTKKPRLNDKTAVVETTSESTIRKDNLTKSPRGTSPTGKSGPRSYHRDRSPTDETSPRGTSPTGKLGQKNYPRDRSPTDKTRKPGLYDETIVIETTSDSTITKDRLTKSPRGTSPTGKSGPTSYPRDRSTTDKISPRRSSPKGKSSPRDYPRDRSPTEKPRKSRPSDETTPTEKPASRQPRPVGETVVKRTVNTTVVDDYDTTKTPRGSSPTKIAPRERSPTQKPTKDSPRRTSPSEKPNKRQPIVNEVEKTVQKTTSKFSKDKIISQKITDYPRRKSPLEKPRGRPLSDEDTDDETTETVIAVYTIDGETVKNHPRDLSPSLKSKSYPKQPSEYSPKRPQTNGDSDHPSEKPRRHQPTDEETEETFISTTQRLTKERKTVEEIEDEVLEHRLLKDEYPEDRPKTTRDQPREISPSGKPRTRQPTDESIDLTVVQKTSRTRKGETTLEETEYQLTEDHPRDRSPSEKPSVRSYPRDSSPKKPTGGEDFDKTVVVKSYKNIPFDDGNFSPQKPKGPRTTEETVMYTTRITSKIEDHPGDRSPSEKSGPRTYPRDRSPTDKTGVKSYPVDKSPLDKPNRPRPSKEETTNQSTTVRKTVQETDFEKRYPKGHPGNQSPSSEKPSTLRRPSRISTTTSTTTTRNRSTLDEQDINRTQRLRTQPSSRDKVPSKTSPLTSPRTQPTTERRVPAELPSPGRKPKTPFGVTTTKTTTVTRSTGASRPKPTIETPKKLSKVPIDSRPSARLTARKPSPSISPDSSPSRPGSDVEIDSPCRSPNMSPSRKSPSPTRSVKLDDITTTTSRTMKTTVSTDNSMPKVTHVTTAKFQITPPTSPTKVCSPEMKVSPSSKKPSSKVPTSRPIGNKFTTDSTTTKKVISKVNKEGLLPTDSERDSEVPTDAEEVDTPLPQKPLTRKLPVTERKESAPVHRVTKVNKDIQMSRSTSENIIKTPITKRPVKHEPMETQREVPRPNGDRSSPKTERRPSKHLSTKTINLTTFDKVINSEDMENVVIDIQHAKSSREPSPNKIVPTPVSVDVYTGKPRYPDVVQEPEDEPKRKPNVKNIPIFEEETNDFVGCQISEVSEETHENTLKSRTTKFIEKESSPRRQTPTIVTGDNVDSECLLSVHDKVSKFISTAEEVSKPKTSAPFRRDLPEEDMPEDDECLLTVDEKVTKFLKTADSVTKEVITSKPRRVERPSIEDIDEELKTDECVLSVSEKVNKFTTKAEKLAPSAPQRSPELVARIGRQISRQSDVESESPEGDDSPAPVRKFKPTSPVTERTEKKYTERQIDILSRPSVWEKKPKPEVKLDDIIGLKPEDEPRRESPSKIYPDDSKSKPLKPTDSVSRRKELFENKVSTNKTTTAITTKQTSSEKRPSRPSAKSPSERYPSDDSDSRYPREFLPQYVDDYGHQEPDDDVHEDVYGSSRTRHIYESSNRETIQKSTELSPIRKTSQPSSRPTTQTTTKSPRQPEDNTPSRRYSEDHSPRYPTRDQPLIDRYTETREASDHNTTRRRSSTQEYPERRTPHNGSHSPLRKQPVEETEEYNRFSSRRDETTTHHHTTHTAPRSPKHSPLNPTSFLDDDEEQDHSPARSTSTVSSHKQVTSHKTTSKRLTEDFTSKRPRRPSGNEPTAPTTGTKTPRGRAVPETVAARRNIFEKSPAPGDISPMPTNRRPSYMEPTKSSLEHRKDSLEITKTNFSRKSSMEEEPYEPSPRTSVKFGVGLKHKDEPKPKRKLSSSDIPNIEDVFELDLLEEMLNIVTLYEQRRRIRAQIRVVKKLLETKTKEEVSRMTKISTIRKTSTSSVKESPTPRRETPSSVRSERYQLTDDDIDSESVIESRHHVEEHEEFIHERSVSPKSKTTRIVKKVTEVQKIGEPSTTPSKRTPLKKDEPTKDSKPIWATKNILKKPSDNEKVTRALSAKETTSTSSSSMSRTQQTHRQRVSTDDDCVTSSYGIGPTDEDGRPLFGIRALKKKTTTNNTVQPSETTKVTGTVITEKYYSENGAEPVGERKVTVYSTNPEDLVDMETQYDRRDSETVKREKLSKDGVTTVTKVQKIGKYKPGEIPSLTDDAEFTKATSKMVRRGSVKEMSEKFIRKESSSSVTEKSSSGYPKAGLILRTRTNSGATADAADQYEVRAKSTEYDYDSEDDVEIRSSRKHSKVVTAESEDEETEIRSRKINTRSFLNSAGSKVTGVDDVLNRMRNADNVVVDGETLEDREARALLNKFLGASVLMSGMESMIPQMELRKTTTTGGADNKQEVKTTRVTKTIKTGTTGASSSSPVARETCDFEEIWDEETLKQLLEKSTSYEERRSIRARLRQLMADREACAELKAGAKAELNETKVKTTTTVAENDESSGSEYEEIIEEYTASEDEDEETATTTTTTVIAQKQQKEELKEEKSAKQITEGVKKTTITKKEEPKSVETKKIVVVETTTAIEENSSSTPSSYVEQKKLNAKSKEEETTNNNNDDDDSDSVSDSKGLSTTTEKTETKKEDGGVVTTTTKVTTRTISGAPKPVSPFAKFQQLDKQNSLQSPKSPLTPTTPGGSSTTPIFRFTDPALNARAATFKEQLLQWCQSKTQEYENVQITNFSASWTDGLAFCALIHHFLPDAFDYSKLNPKQRRYNFELAFRVADEKAGIAPLLDVEDMVVMKRPDWKCVFTYVQSIYRRFRNCQ